MHAFSALGEHGAIWFALCAVTALDRRRRPAALRAGAAVAGAFVVNVAVKNVVRRPRPDLEDLPPLTGTPTGLSFPSTHSATGFAGARALTYAGWPGGVTGPLAVALAGSRLYLGVHYPTDILAGAALGLFVGGLAR